MLDQHDRGSVVVIHVQDEAAHVLLFLDIHTGHGFIKQQNFGLRRQGPPEFDAFLQAVGQAFYRRFADVLNLQELDDLFDRLAVGSLFALRARQLESDLEEVGMLALAATGHDVVQHRHTFEQRDVLKGTRYTQARRPVGRHVAELLATQGDRAFLRPVDPVDHIQHGAFPRAVGADDGADFVLQHIERNVGQGLDAAKAQRDRVELQNGLADGKAPLDSRHVVAWGVILGCHVHVRRPSYVSAPRKSSRHGF